MVPNKGDLIYCRSLQSINPKPYFIITCNVPMFVGVVLNLVLCLIPVGQPLIILPGFSTVVQKKDSIQ